MNESDSPTIKKFLSEINANNAKVSKTVNWRCSMNKLYRENSQNLQKISTVECFFSRVVGLFCKATINWCFQSSDNLVYFFSIKTKIKCKRKIKNPDNFLSLKFGQFIQYSQIIQLTFTCSKSTIKTLERVVKYVKYH